jgi:hypothetical protein
MKLLEMKLVNTVAWLVSNAVMIYVMFSLLELGNSCVHLIEWNAGWMQ